MIDLFTLERVNRAPASFDPNKLFAFQERYMQRLPLAHKTEMVLPYLQKAGLVSDPAPCEVGPKLTRIVEASGDRLKTAGDILAYADFFFVPDDQLAYDEKDFQKRVAPPQAKELLTKFRAVLSTTEPFEPAALEGKLHVDVDTASDGFGDIWHAVIHDFFARSPLADVRISINDNGATPATVALRLDQAMEEFLEGDSQGRRSDGPPADLAGGGSV